MVNQDIQRKLAVLLHADVVDSTLLVRKNETLAHRKIREVFQRFSQTIAAHGGAALEIRGDALVAEFGRASDAVSASVEFQKGNSIHNTTVESDVSPQIRIGISMGEVVVADGTVTGEGIVMAQRLEQLAAPGGVCIQAAAYETVPGRLGYGFVNTGKHQLKGFDDPVRVFSSVALESKPGSDPESDLNSEQAPGSEVFSNSGSRQSLSIAVLPFDNMSGDKEQEYFSDGITEDILTELSRFRNLFVCARHSSFTFKDRVVDVKTAGRELGVIYIVEGSVRKAGNRVRVTVQLVSAESGAHIWAERYDRDLDDIFAVQDEVVSAVVAQLGVSLRREAMDFARDRPTESLTAYDNLLRARSAWWRGEWNEGFRYTRSALGADPNYAQAQAWMALQYAYQTYSHSMGLTDEEISDGAKTHAEKALQLNDRDPFIHMAASMGFGFTPVPDKHRGLHHSDISFAMNPYDVDVLYCRAYQLAWSGRLFEALDCLKRLEELNPLASFMHGECYADIYYLLEQYEDCLNCYQGRGEAPNQVKVTMAASYAKLGRIEEARSSVNELRQHDPDYDIEGFVRSTIALCFTEQDAGRYRDGFQLAGIDV
jgi:TolB-like protein